MDRPGYVYIMASQRNGTLYIGVTSDLARRVSEHRDGLVDGFTRQYGVKRLVHVERFSEMRAAITREKQLKEWRRAWKLDLIQSDNQEWRDLFVEMYPTAEPR